MDVEVKFSNSERAMQLWMSYNRATKQSLTWNEFDELYVADVMAAVMNAPKGAPRSFKITYKDGTEQTMSLEDLEYYINCDEPHSSEWTPYHIDQDGINNIMEWFDDQFESIEEVV